MPPLDGLTVLDLTRVVAGPYCTMLLGDMGATVLKIEEPTRGDDTRSWGPFHEGYSTFFLGLNRSKQSVALDLKSRGGAATLRRLIENADVLVENFRPGSLDALGFGYPEASTINPRLVYCSITGYGRSGPKRDLPGYDAVIQAESGFMDVTGDPDGPPTRAGVAITDYLAGLCALSGILLALRHRDRSGEGQHVDIGLLDALTSALTLPALAFLNAGETLGREGNRHHSLTPYEAIRVADGLVVVAVGNPRLWARFCDAIDAVEMRDDPRFATNDTRMTHRPDLIAALERRLASWTGDTLIGRLRAHAVPCGKVAHLPDALDEPQLAARGMVVDLPHPRLGRVRTLGNPITLSTTPAVVDRPPPELGAHTAEIVARLDARTPVTGRGRDDESS